jgi:hypothetical protein
MGVGLDGRVEVAPAARARHAVRDRSDRKIAKEQKEIKQCKQFTKENGILMRRVPSRVCLLRRPCGALGLQAAWKRGATVLPAASA